MNNRSGVLCSMSWPVCIRKYQKSLQCIPSHVFLLKRQWTALATPSLFIVFLSKYLTFMHHVIDWFLCAFAYILGHQTVFFHLPSSHWLAVPDIGLQSRQAFCSHFLNYTVPRGLVCRTSLQSRPCSLFAFGLFFWGEGKVISSFQLRKMVGVI